MKKITVSLLLITIIFNCSVCFSQNAFSVTDVNITQSGYEFFVEANVFNALADVVSYKICDEDKIYYLGDVGVVDGKINFSFGLSEDALFGEYNIVFGAIKSQPVTIPFTYYESIEYDGSVKAETLSVSAGEPFEIFEKSDIVSIKAVWENEDECKKTVKLEIIDYFGNTVLTQSKNTSEKIGSVSFEIENLNVGHYSAKVSVNNEEASAYFAVSYNDFERENEKDGMIGVCTAGIELKGNDFEYIDNFAKSLKRAGIKDVREIIRWYNTEKSTGEYNFAQYDEWINKYNEHGISVLGMYDYTPYIYRESGVDAHFPNNLKAAYNFAYNIADYFKGRIDNWEIYNEVDMANSSVYTDKDTANHYASLLKASSLGIKDANSEAKISFAGLSDTYQGFFDKLMMNDVNKYFDIYNFHYHVQATSSDYPVFSKINQKHYKNILEYDISDKDVWVTEAGVYMPVESDDVNLSMDEQIFQARYAATSCVTSLSQGADKHFYFTWTHYIENLTELGTFSDKMQPYASYSALSALTKVINGKTYYGKIKNDDIEGYAFSDDEETAVCLWSKDESHISLDIGRSNATLIDIMGNEQKIYSDNGVFALDIGPDICYLKIDGEYPISLVELKQKTVKEEKDNNITISDRIVINQKFGQDTYKNARNDSYKVKDGDTVAVEVYNFNDKLITGSISAKTYAGFSVTPSVIDAQIAPMGKTTLTFTINVDDNESNTQKVPLVFDGVFEGNAITKSVSYISADNEKNISITQFEGFNEPSNWRRNTYSSATRLVEKTQDNDISFSYGFTDEVVLSKNIYAYPEFSVDLSEKANCDGIAFTITTTDASDLNFKCYVYEENTSAYRTLCGVDVNETGTYNIRFSWDDFIPSGSIYDENEKLDVETIKKIRIGFNSKTQKNVNYVLSNFGLYTEQKPQITVHSQISDTVYSNKTLSSTFTPCYVPLKMDTLRYIVNDSYSLKNGEFGLSYGIYDITTCVFDESSKLIKMYKTITTKEDDFKVENASFSKPTIYGQNTVDFSVDVTNVNSDIKETVLVFAQYNQYDELVYTEFIKQDIVKNNSHTFDYTINNILSDTKYIKVFLINGWSTIKPIVTQIKFN